MNRFGRDELEWQELLDSATDQLKTLARSQRLTTYGELNASLAHDTGLAAFDLGTEGAGTHSASSHSAATIWFAFRASVKAPFWSKHKAGSTKRVVKTRHKNWPNWKLSASIK